MRYLRLGLALPLLAAMVGCTSSSDNVLSTAFPIQRLSRPESRIVVPPGSFTVDRVLGRPDGLEPLGPDNSLNLFEADGRSLRDLLDVEGRRELRDVRMPPDVVEPPAQPPPRRRGSSTPPQANVLPEVEPRPVAPPPSSAPPVAARPLTSGTTIPGPAGGTVVGGSAGSTATTIGPSGRPGTATRDGGTVTLFGADGSIRTVPVPPR